MGRFIWQLIQPSCPTAGCSPWAAALAWASSVGYPWAVAFRPHTLLYRGLLHGCTGRSALCGACGLQEDGMLLHGPLLGCRELLLHAWSSSCPLCTVLGACMAASLPFLPPLSQLLVLSSVSLSSACSPRAHPVLLMAQLWHQQVPGWSSWSSALTWGSAGLCLLRLLHPYSPVPMIQIFPKKLSASTPTEIDFRGPSISLVLHYFNIWK